MPPRGLLFIFEIYTTFFFQHWISLFCCLTPLFYIDKSFWLCDPYPCTSIYLFFLLLSFFVGGFLIFSPLTLSLSLSLSLSPPICALSTPYTTQELSLSLSFFLLNRLSHHCYFFEWTFCFVVCVLSAIRVMVIADAMLQVSPHKKKKRFVSVVENLHTWNASKRVTWIFCGAQHNKASALRSTYVNLSVEWVENLSWRLVTSNLANAGGGHHIYQLHFLIFATTPYIDRQEREEITQKGQSVLFFFTYKPCILNSLKRDLKGWVSLSSPLPPEMQSIQ